MLLVKPLSFQLPKNTINERRSITIDIDNLSGRSPRRASSPLNHPKITKIWKQQCHPRMKKKSFFGQHTYGFNQSPSFPVLFVLSVIALQKSLFISLGIVSQNLFTDDLQTWLHRITASLLTIFHIFLALVSFLMS